MKCHYIPQINAEFGRTITDGEINFEFQAIEEAMTCLDAQYGTHTSFEDRIHDYGIIDNSYTLDPAFGVLQYMALIGDVELELSHPKEGESKLITLVIANAGSLATNNYGRFNFKTGTAWSADRDDVMDGKPWNMFANIIGDTSGTQYAGFYGAIVTCIHDGNNWIYIVYARHHLDIWNDPIVEDIYNWR